MAQLQMFTRKMMERVIAAHVTRTMHDGNCCELAAEYASVLASETTPAQPQVPATFREDLFPESGITTTKPPAQRKASPGLQETKMASDRALDYILSLGRRVSLNLISPAHRDLLQKVRNGHTLKAREASELIEALKAQTDERPRPASDKQIQYLHTLVKSRAWTGTIDFENLTASVASGLINDLKNSPRKSEVEEDEVPAGAGYPEVGFYYVDGDYYKVQDPKVNGGRRYAKKWHPQAEKFIYNGQKSFYLLKPETKLTAEQASRFGKLYGKCIARGCALTDEASIHWGYGEKCASNHGWPYSKNY